VIRRGEGDLTLPLTSNGCEVDRDIDASLLHHRDAISSGKWHPFDFDIDVTQTQAGTFTSLLSHRVAGWQRIKNPGGSSAN
jgi:hypothetical protein